MTVEYQRFDIVRNKDGDQFLRCRECLAAVCPTEPPTSLLDLVHAAMDHTCSASAPALQFDDSIGRCSECDGKGRK